MNEIYDAVVIGAGSAGYSFAIASANLGWRVLLVEKDKVGGTCLNRGCIPTKALLKIAKIRKDIVFGRQLGLVNSDNIAFNFDKSHHFKSDIVKTMSSGLTFLLSHTKNLTYLSGKARVDLEGSAVTVGEEQYRYRKLILATGRKPILFPNFKDSVRDMVMTSDSILDLKKVPNSLVVLGGGSIGCEFASLFRSLGSKVTILEYAKSLLNNCDAAISKRLEESFSRLGIDVITSSEVLEIKRAGRATAAVVEYRENDGSVKHVTGDCVLSSIGREIEDIDGVNSEILLDRDDIFSEVHKDVYCIGDILNTPQLAHVAYREGISLAQFLINGDKDTLNYKNTPAITYSIPEVAMVGYTEDEAIKKFGNESIVCKEYDLKHNAKALIEGDVYGHVKIVTQNGQIIGVHIISNSASELITEASLITSWEASVDDLSKIIHPHPTESEFYSEIALTLTGQPLHVR